MSMGNEALPGAGVVSLFRTQSCFQGGKWDETNADRIGHCEGPRKEYEDLISKISQLLKNCKV